METLNRYDIIEAGDLSEDDDVASRSDTGRWMEAEEVLAFQEQVAKRACDMSEVRERQSEQLEYLEERVRVLSETEQELKEQNRSLLVQREKKLLEFQKSEDQNDELRLDLRMQTKRAEDMVTMNATLIASRNSVQIARDQAITSCRLSNRLRDVEHTELVQQRARVLHLTGRILDAATLLHRLLRSPNFETVQHAREFIAIIKNETEGYTLTGPGDMPLLYAKIDLLKEDGTPLTPGEHCPRCDSPATTLHPAMQHEGEVQMCTDPWHASDAEGRRVLEREGAPLPAPEPGVLTPVPTMVVNRSDTPSGAVGLLDVAEPLTPDHDACRDPQCPGHQDMPF